MSERNDPRLQQLDHLWVGCARVYYRRADVVTANTGGVLDALQAMGPWKRLDSLAQPLPGGLSLQDSPPSRVTISGGAGGGPSGAPEGSGCADPCLRVSAAVGPRRLVRHPGWRWTGVAPNSWKHWPVMRGSDRFVSDSLGSLVFVRRASIFALPSRFEGMPNAA